MSEIHRLNNEIDKNNEEILRLTELIEGLRESNKFKRTAIEVYKEKTIFANDVNDSFTPTDCVSYLFKAERDDGSIGDCEFKLIRAVNLKTMEDVTELELVRLKEIKGEKT